MLPLKASASLSPTGHSWSLSDYVAVGAVAVAAIVVFANSLGNDFVYDDRPICLEDTRTRDLSHLRDIFTQHYWAGSSVLGLDLSAERLDPIYRPVTLLSLALNHAVTGTRAAGYRAVNLVLHAAVSVAVYVLCMLLLRERRVALMAALLFAVHPVHTEAVVPIVGRSELLAAAAVTWGMVLYIQDALKSPSRTLSGRYAAAVTLFLVGVFSKESAITFVGLAVIVDIWLRARGAAGDRSPSWSSYLRNRLIRRYVGLLAVAAFFLAIRRLVVGHVFSSAGLIPPTLNPLVLATPWQRVLTCLVVLAMYARLLLVPHPLSYDYSSAAVEVPTTLWGGPVLAGVLCLVVMIAATVCSWRRKGGLAIAILFFAATYSVASNLVFRIGVLMAERLIYLPSIGACMALAVAWAALFSSWSKAVWGMGLGKRVVTAGEFGMMIGFVTVGAIYCHLTVTRNSVWRNNRTLYETDVKTQPRSHKVWLNLGLLSLASGEQDRGIQYLKEAVRLAPHSYDALAQLGWQYIKMGQTEEALRYLSEAGRYRWPQETFTLWLRAELLQKVGRTGDAAALYEEALRANPDHEISLVNLAAIYADPDSGAYYDLNKAYGGARRAALLPAPQPQSLVALADVCVKQGKREEARATIARGFRLLAAYREKAREMGKLNEQTPMYDQLEAVLGELRKTVEATGTYPTTMPR